MPPQLWSWGGKCPPCPPSSAAYDAVSLWWPCHSFCCHSASGSNPSLRRDSPWIQSTEHRVFCVYRFCLLLVGRVTNYIIRDCETPDVIAKMAELWVLMRGICLVYQSGWCLLSCSRLFFSYCTDGRDRRLMVVFWVSALCLIHALSRPWYMDNIAMLEETWTEGECQQDPVWCFVSLRACLLGVCSSHLTIRVMPVVMLGFVGAADEYRIGSVFRVRMGWLTAPENVAYFLPLSTFTQTLANNGGGSYWKCVCRRWQLWKRYTDNHINLVKTWMSARSGVVLCLLANICLVGVCTWHPAIVVFHMELCQLSRWKGYPLWCALPTSTGWGSLCKVWTFAWSL